MEGEKITQDETFKEGKSPPGIKPLSAIAHRMFHPPKLER